jgi:hypothetical protein
MKMAPIQSLAQFWCKVASNPNYRKLALVTAENLGGHPDGDLKTAKEWIQIYANETDEEAVVEEINACRDLVEE